MFRLNLLAAVFARKAERRDWLGWLVGACFLPLATLFLSLSRKRE